MGKRTILAGIKSANTNWLLSLVLAVFGLAGSTAFALDLMGPPTGGLKQGQFHVGLDYSYSEMDLEFHKGRFVRYLDGWFNEAGGAESFTLKDFRINKACANFGYGLADNLEAFLRVGGTNATFDGSTFWPEGEEFDSHADFAVGFGAKVTFYEQGDLKIGGLFQVSWSEFDGALRPKDWPVADDCVEMDITEIQIAVGPSYRFTDRFSIYGGPFLHFTEGNWDDVYSEIDEATGGLLTSKYSWSVQEDSVLGAYMGAQVELTENCSVNIECQLTSAAEAVGVGLLWRF
jgi:opacity protein-like surface antigen